MLVFKVSTKYPKVRLLFELQYEQIPPNVSKGNPNSGFDCEAS
jgi:hypothetical protein